jgi:hypothetical protein
MTIVLGLIIAIPLPDPAKGPDPAASAMDASNHWSFQPIVQPVLPSVQSRPWSIHPIDRFIAAKQEASGIPPAPPAEPTAVLRRTFLDVIGLPPTPEQQAEFEKLPSQAALDEWVDTLLNHPGYGERWARHWLDLVRYADSNGYERDSDKPFAWRYRDYVIRSFNEDKRYDDFVREQIAGDSIPGLPVDAQVGLGFYLIGPWDDEPTNLEQARYDQLDDFASTTSQVFLGLDVGCARCHDHKQDPITQQDYYSFAAIFADVRRPVRYGREVMMRVGNANDVEQSRRMSQQVEQIQQEIIDLRLQLAKSLRASSSSEGATEKGSSADPSSTAKSADEPVTSPGEITRKLVELRRQAAELERELPVLPPAYLPQFDGPVEPCFVLLRGEINSKGNQVEPNLPAHLRKILPIDSAGAVGRSDFADWLCRTDNPLVPRVIVNRVWQHHFGLGLVRSPHDFGRGGESPTHAELLDWLAHWFVHEADWSLKKLHRLILTSKAYRSSQQSSAEVLAADPENRLYSRFPRQRLEVEAIHDAMLSASGRLNSKMFGPPFYPSLKDSIKRSHESAYRVWLPYSERDASRRAIYAVVKRSLAVPLFEAMDRCDPNRSIGRRNSSNGASQALVALNDEFVSRQSHLLAERLQREAAKDPAAQIHLAYRLVLCRAPTAEESAAIVDFVRKNQMDRPADQTAYQRADVELSSLAEACRAILNLNEFYYPD